MTQTTTPPAAFFPKSFPFTAAVVIGGYGFIGSRLVADLRARGVPVVILDDCSRNSPGGLGAISGKLDMVEGSVLDRKAVRRAVHLAAHAAAIANGGRFDTRMEKVAVFLLAACVSNGDLSPDQYRINAYAPILVTDVLSDINDDPKVLIDTTLVFASSFAVYGDVPFGETPDERRDHFIRPVTGYGRSKRDAECAIRALASGREFSKYVVLRFSNVVGASDRVGDIITADPSGGLSYNMIRQEQVVLSSRARDTRDGLTWRNFIDVRDVSAAMMHAATFAYTTDKPAHGDKYNCNPRVFNICAANPNPIVDFVNAANVPVRFVDAPHQPGDVAYSDGSFAWFYMETGWIPAFTLQDSADAIAARRAVVRGAM